MPQNDGLGAGYIKLIYFIGVKQSIKYNTIDYAKSILIFLAFLFVSCTDKTKLKTITIGEYSFDFPNDFKQVEEQGIDSYIGKVKGDSIELGFDYGYYSDRLVETEQEYIEKKIWLQYAGYQFMKPGITYDNNNYPKIEFLGLRQTTNGDTAKFKNADFIAKCKHDSILFDYPITLPAKTKQHIVKIDTIQNHLRRIIIAKNSLNGLTGIFLMKLNNYNQSMNSSTALSMATSGLTKKQQDSVLKIFSTLKFVSNK